VRVASACAWAFSALVRPKATRFPAATAFAVSRARALRALFRLTTVKTYFTEAQKRWMRPQASSSTFSDVA